MAGDNMNLQQILMQRAMQSGGATDRMPQTTMGGFPGVKPGMGVVAPTTEMPPAQDEQAMAGKQAMMQKLFGGMGAGPQMAPAEAAPQAGMGAAMGGGMSPIARMLMARQQPQGGGMQPGMMGGMQKPKTYDGGFGVMPKMQKNPGPPMGGPQQVQ